MADNTSKIDQEQIAGVIVNSVTGPSVNSTDPKNVIIPEIPSVDSVNNKANKDGTNTNGGVWQIDYIMSEVLPGNKSVLRVFANGTIEYGNATVRNHVFVSDNNQGLSVMVNGNLGQVWHSFNFDPSDYALKSDVYPRDDLGDIYDEIPNWSDELSMNTDF